MDSTIYATLPPVSSSYPSSESSNKTTLNLLFDSHEHTSFDDDVDDSGLTRQIDFIPETIRRRYANPSNSTELRFKCRRGLERCYFVISSDRISILPRLAARCAQTSEQNEAPLNQSVSLERDPDLKRSHPRALLEMTRLQKSIIKNDFRSRTKSAGKGPIRFIRWEAVCGIVSIRKSFFESWVGIEVTTGSVVKVLISNKCADVLVNAVRAFYCSTSAGLLKHTHHEGKGNASITVQTPRWDQIAEYHNVLLPGSSRMNHKLGEILFSTCKKHSILEEPEIFQLNSSVSNPIYTAPNPLASVMGTDPENKYRCPYCSHLRGGKPILKPKPARTKVELDVLNDDLIQDHATTPIQWLTEAMLEDIIPLPFDCIAKLFVMNRALPSRISQSLSNPSDDHGGLMTYIFNGVDQKEKTWGPQPSYMGTEPFGALATNAVKGLAPPICPEGEGWVPPSAKPIQLTTKHSLPDNFIMNRILSLLPAIPSESDGFEVMKLIYCSTDLLVIDWVGYIVEHRDLNGEVVDKGIPSHVLYGGLQPHLRLIFQRDQYISDHGMCQCKTKIATRLGFRYNDQSIFEFDTQMKKPDEFNYSSSVSSGPLRMIQSIVGKQELAASTGNLCRLLRDECEYLKCTVHQERESFLEPLTHKTVKELDATFVSTESDITIRNNNIEVEVDIPPVWTDGRVLRRITLVDSDSHDEISKSYDVH